MLIERLVIAHSINCVGYDLTYLALNATGSDSYTTEMFQAALALVRIGQLLKV